MKLAIMQPYFFPYLGYFSLIKHTDRFILLDEVQFIYHGWIERNRIWSPTTEWQYIQVPLKKHSRTEIIRNVVIDNVQPWKEKMLAQCQHYKKAPFFEPITAMIRQIFREECSSITKLNRNCLQAVCDYLEINREIAILSEMNLCFGIPNAPDDWALNICNALGNVDTYCNPIGGIELFDHNKYASNGIKLTFLKHSLTPYRQKSNKFIPGLSILDVLMFNSVQEVNRMLDNFSLN